MILSFCSKTRQEGGPSSWKCQDFVVLLRRKDNCIKVRLPMENKPTPLPLFAFVFFSICALEQMRFFCCYCCSLPNCPDSLSWELNQSKKCDKCNIFRLCSWVPRVQISLLIYWEAYKSFFTLLLIWENLLGHPVLFKNSPYFPMSFVLCQMSHIHVRMSACRV